MKKTQAVAWAYARRSATRFSMKWTSAVVTVGGIKYHEPPQS